MAGPNDIRRETIRLRREQQKRNEAAIAEREARLTELEKQSGRGSTTDRQHRASARRRATGRVIREGHRVRTAEPGSLDGVGFASKGAEKKARAAGLSWEDFAGARPTGKGGYTSRDVERAESRKRSREEVEDKMDRGSGVRIEDK